MWEQTHFLSEETDTKAFGRAIAKLLAAGDTVALSGPLGAGKSTLARAIIATLTDEQDAPSPTFGLVQPYEFAGVFIQHVDLYRLEHKDELLEIGLDDALGRDLCLIEWPEKAADRLPENTLLVRLTPEGPGRRLMLRGGDMWQRRFATFNPAATGRTP